jgi:cytoskeletal protein CcmA (bactofilin family)
MSIFSSNKETPPTPQINNIPPRMEPVVASSILPTYGSSSSSSSPLTIISEGTMLEGQIKIEGDIKIEGNIKGSVTSKGKVIISNNGKVDGDIICQNAEISGYVTGKLKIADILFLKGSAIIDGDINTGKLVIENGVKFNGNCSMGAPAAPAAAAYVAPKLETLKPPMNTNSLGGINVNA